jgi:hypothetical protein
MIYETILCNRNFNFIFSPLISRTSLRRILRWSRALGPHARRSRFAQSGGVMRGSEVCLFFEFVRVAAKANILILKELILVTGKVRKLGLLSEIWARLNNWLATLLHALDFWKWNSTYWFSLPFCSKALSTGDAYFLSVFLLLSWLVGNVSGWLWVCWLWDGMLVLVQELKSEALGQHFVDNCGLG